MGTKYIGGVMRRLRDLGLYILYSVLADFVYCFLSLFEYILWQPGWLFGCKEFDFWEGSFERTRSGFI